MYQERKRQASTHSSTSLQLSVSHSPAVLPFSLDVSCMTERWIHCRNKLQVCLDDFSAGKLFFLALPCWSDVTDVLDVTSCTFRRIELSLSTKTPAMKKRYTCDVDHTTSCCGQPWRVNTGEQYQTALLWRGQVSAHVSPPHPTILSLLSALYRPPSQPLPLSR